MSESNWVIANIYYTGIGSNFRTHFCEKEFREIIANVYLKYFDINTLTKKQLHYFSQVIENPQKCHLQLLLEFTGAKRI